MILRREQGDFYRYPVLFCTLEYRPERGAIYSGIGKVGQGLS
jgi:hypothetical protein